MRARKKAVRSRNSGSHRRLLSGHDDDPLGGVANLFDVAMVFAVAILLVLLSRAPMVGALSASDSATVLKNPNEPDMEIIVRDGERLEHYRVSENELQGSGERLGVAYRLENGEVVYVPNVATKSSKR
ncbi:hypothetical protein K2D_42970 [Planctomycetes bacterium K2D]|uniref:DUF2149 domain-containing protein n=1 Tax=Botrimarina mediterranea TaxID=2528022 RepID=A0A518KE47_9BACT|nr:hypothetical protein Spa11_42960 [Botrimarina mediterranea]QDV80667.1 hypothetical protein K2D_42970 [Planctomycetes bacterium K2D]